MLSQSTFRWTSGILIIGPKTHYSLERLIAFKGMWGYTKDTRMIYTKDAHFGTPKKKFRTHTPHCMHHIFEELERLSSPFDWIKRMLIHGRSARRAKSWKQTNWVSYMRPNRWRFLYLSKVRHDLRLWHPGINPLPFQHFFTAMA